METVNLERLREASMEDEEFMGELIDIFLDDMPRQLEALRAAIQKDDATSIMAAAHRLKGASGNVGAESLGSLCQQIERLGREDQLDEVPQLLEEVGQESSRVHEYLMALKKNDNPS